jgi:hypothetical protein
VDQDLMIRRRVIATKCKLIGEASAQVVVLIDQGGNLVLTRTGRQDG